MSVLINKKDTIKLLGELRLNVKDTSSQPSDEKFVEFDVNKTSVGRLEFEGKVLYLWSGLGEHFDYASSFVVKTMGHLEDVLEVLTNDHYLDVNGINA